MFSCLSYNIHLGKKLPQVVTWLKENPNFDIICLQEVPQQDVEKVIEALKPLSIEHKYSVSIVKGEKKFGQLTLVNAKKLSIVDGKTISLGTARFERRIMRHKTERSALVTTIKYKDMEFVLANVHLVCLALNALRRQQIVRIIDTINARESTQTFPKLIIGDFNYSSFVRQKQFIKFMKSYGFTNAYRIKTHRLFLLKHQLDYAFYSGCKIKRVKVLRLKFSDHVPITFDLQFGRKSL